MNQNNSNNKKSPLGGYRGLSVLITGGSRGIGLGIAKELAKAGFNLAINGVRNLESVQHVLNDLNDFGVEVIYAQGDVSKKEDRKKILQTVIACKYLDFHAFSKNIWGCKL